IRPSTSASRSSEPRAILLRPEIVVGSRQKGRSVRTVDDARSALFRGSTPLSGFSFSYGSSNQEFKSNKERLMKRFLLLAVALMLVASLAVSQDALPEGVRKAHFA